MEAERSEWRTGPEPDWLWSESVSESEWFEGILGISGARVDLFLVLQSAADFRDFERHGTSAHGKSLNWSDY